MPADAAGPSLLPFSDAASCGPSYVRAGSRPGGGLWVTCQSEGGSLTVRRVDASGTNLGSESLARTGFIDGDTTAISPDGRIFYAWDPGSSMLMRVDRVIARARATEGDTLLFAHGHVLRNQAARWIGEPPSEGRLFALSTATVSVLGWEREQPVIERWNDQAD
jgi:hypothetical protein